MRKFLRPISFFVCSNYRDMKAERAYLHDVILPQVGPLFEERGFRLEFKDPRQQSRSEDDADGPNGLSQSLAFIDRCRPCFLGFFGVNYGRVLPRVPDQIGQHYPEIQFYARSSRAHLETLYGVLQAPHKAEHSFFYFRKPEFMESMSADDRALLESSTPSASQRGVEEFKLRMLKEAIVNSGRPVRKYDCKWDVGSKQVTGLDALGERIKADLMSVVENLFPRPAGAAAPVAAVPAAEPVAVAEAVPVSATPSKLAAAAPPAAPPSPAESVPLSSPVEAFSEADGLLMKELAAETAGLATRPDESHPAAEETLHGDEEALKIEAESGAEIPAGTPKPEDEPVALPEDQDALDFTASAADADQGMTSMVGRSGLAHLSGMDGGTPPAAAAPEVPAEFFAEEEASEPAIPIPEGAEPVADNPFAFVEEAPAVDQAFAEVTSTPDVQLVKPGEEVGKPITVIPIGVVPEGAAEPPGDEAALEAAAAAALADVSVPPAAPALNGDHGVLEQALQGPDGERLRSERRELLRKLATNPEDRDALLAYADWLNGLGDPLGEFIRLDLDLHNRPPDEARKTVHDRWGELLDRHGKEWVQPLEALGLSPKLYGEFSPTLWLNHGVIESVTINKEGVLPKRAAELFEAAPALRKITFEECSVNMPEIAELPQLEQIVFLGLRAVSLDGDDVRAIAHSPHLAGLTELDLNDNPFGPGGAAALASSPNLRSLESLELGNCAIGPDGTGALAHSGLLQTVRRLNLASNGIGSEGLRALVASPHLGNLRALFLGWNGLGDDGARALATAPNLGQLEALDLAGNRLTAAGVKALAESAILAHLSYLDLTANESVGNGGVQALASWAHGGQIKGLKLSRCHIGDEGVLALAMSDRLAGLTKLDLGNNNLNAASAHAIASSAHLADLKDLDLRENDLGPEGIQAILQSPHLSRIEMIWLTGTGFTPEQEEALKLRFGNAANLY